MSHHGRACACLILSVSWLASPTLARADIYSYIDKDGVVHFTNMPRPGPKWRRVMRTGPGKAAAVSAAPRRSDRDPERAQRYTVHIQQASLLYHIPVELIRAVIRIESDYHPRVVSRAGAQGLMQLMPRTARGMGVTEAFDPRQNIFGGTRFLRVLANQFRGDLVLTIAGYHAGAGAVMRYGYNIPPYQTTQSYVRMVLREYYKHRRLAAR